MSDKEYRTTQEVRREVKRRLISTTHDNGDVEFYVVESSTLKYEKKREEFTPNTIDYGMTNKKLGGNK